MNLSQFSGKRIALVMEVQGREVVLRGTTAVRHSSKDEHILQVTVFNDGLAGYGRPVFLISEPRWRQQIASGSSFDCDYCLNLSCSAVGAA
ncbi:MAG: hypothetical protein ACYC0X_06760 [Pirellulaceae bacterium]